jgi:hypothetical protein
VLHHRHSAELEDMMVNETPNPLMATPDTYPVGIPVPLQVVSNRYDEDRDNHVITLKGNEDGDQVTFRVPPGMAKMFPLEMTVDATVNFEVLA